MPPLLLTTSSAPPLVPLSQPTNVVPLQYKPRTEPRRKSSSAEYSWPLPSVLHQLAQVLRDTPRLVQPQGVDARVSPIGRRLRGEGDTQAPNGTAGYGLDDNNLVWSALQAEALMMPIPRAQAPEVLDSCTAPRTPGYGADLLAGQGKVLWLTVAQDVRKYALSCGYRRKKRSAEPASRYDAYPVTVALESVRDEPPRHETGLPREE